MSGAIIDRRISGGDEMSVGGGGAMEGAIVNSGAAMQRTASTYATAVAVQRPRVLSRVEQVLLVEANLAGESFFYGWGAGKDRIEGPSVDCANAAFRAWGNCAIEMAPVQETHDAWIFTAIFVDLENGISMPRQFRQSKRWNVYGKLDDFRKEDIRFQIGQSKAIRNVILNALPKWLVTKAIDQAKQGARASLEKFIGENGVAKAVELVLKSLAKHGVNEERVLAKAGVAKREALDVDRLVILRSDAAALNDGREFASELFPAVDKGGDEKPAAPLADRIREQQAKTLAAAAPVNVADEPPADPDVPDVLDEPSADEITPSAPPLDASAVKSFEASFRALGASLAIPERDVEDRLSKARVHNKLSDERIRRKVLDAFANGALEPSGMIAP